MPPKGDPRAAGERIEKGIERYGDGDLVGAAVELEEALRLFPEHARAKQMLSWVKDVLAGSRGNGKKKDLDEDAVRAVTEALDSDEESESPWSPVPLTPTHFENAPPLGTAIPTLPYAQGDLPVETPAEPPRAAETLVAPQPPTMHKAPILPTLTKAPTLPPAKDTSRDSPSSGTILGIAPQRESVLLPIPRAPAPEDPPESVTKEFERGTLTMQNLPPLDVPELTEDQVAELISLESSLPTTGPGGQPLTSDLATTPDLPTEQRAFLEFTADPTPPPHRFVTQSDAHRKDDTPLGLHTLRFGADFDPLEVEPTRSRPGPMAPPLNPLPVDEQLGGATEEERDEDTQQNPTNPFIRSKLATYAYGQTRDDEPPTDRASLPIADRFAVARRSLAEGDLPSALDLADELVTEAGGTEADPVLPYLSLLEKIYEEMIGSFDRVPEHGGAVPDLDPRAAFLLSRLDGSMSVDDLLDVSGMPRLEAMRVLALLIRHGAVITK